PALDARARAGSRGPGSRSAPPREPDPPTAPPPPAPAGARDAGGTVRRERRRHRPPGRRSAPADCGIRAGAGGSGPSGGPAPDGLGAAGPGGDRVLRGAGAGRPWMHSTGPGAADGPAAERAGRVGGRAVGRPPPRPRRLQGVPARERSRTVWSRPAVSSLPFVYQDSTAVLGALPRLSEPHAYHLCREHASRMTPPPGGAPLRVPGGQEARDGLVALADAVTPQPA